LRRSEKDSTLWTVLLTKWCTRLLLLLLRVDGRVIVQYVGINIAKGTLGVLLVCYGVIGGEGGRW